MLNDKGRSPSGKTINKRQESQTERSYVNDCS